ncbi:MAG: stage II sporulation protein E [Defluviitaleaceae bacterium]|nr:stage II sporulation protein E [Defluviitaleaceae bacterium]
MHIPVGRARLTNETKRTGIAEKSENRKPVPGKRELAFTLVAAFGFFIGRATVFGFINPLAVPFLAAFMGAAQGFGLTAVFVSLGLATRLGDFIAVRYILAVVLLCGYYFFMTRATAGESRSWLRLPWVSAAAAGAVFFAGVIVASLYGMSAFLFTVAILETVLIGALTFVIKRANIILTRRKRRVKLLSGEDIASVTIVFSGIIAGASDIYVGMMPLRIFFCVYVICIVAFKGGASMAAAAGMLMGFFLHLAGYWGPEWAAVLGLAGLGGGFAGGISVKNKRLSRPAVIAGIGVAGAGALFLLARPWLGFSMIYALIAAGLAFVITPQSFYFNVASAINPVLDSADDYMDKIKEETTRRLDSFASAFGKLADTFSGLSKPKTGLNKHDIALLIDDLSGRVCGTCPSREWCWEEDLYNTHRQVFSMLNACAGRGAATFDDFDKSFRNDCKHPEIFLQELNAIFGVYRNDLRWHNKIAESRELISQQLHGVSGIVKCLSDEIDMSLRFHEGLEEEMIMALLKQKIDVKSVIVLEDNSGKYRVSITHKPCIGKKSCTNEILPVLNAVLKRKMRVEPAENTGCGGNSSGCNLRFAEDQKLRVSSGVAFRAKSSRGSGDSYSAMELRNGLSVLVLSDGMGSGERARRESAATVGLLEDFIESGFDKELAVRMINSVLILKSNEESFSTLDICSVDLYTGKAEFIKIGAAETYLLRDGHISVIRSSSLPIGMLNDVDLEITERQLKHGDIILMVTDGVTAAGSGASAGSELAEDEPFPAENWLKAALKTANYADPQDLADHILSVAERRSREGLKDDMTILAARVWQKA